jgi:hypothetical protein
VIGLWGAHAGTFLVILASGTLLLFGLPMFLSPLRWAKVLGWRIPEHTHLAIYFGRCLASVVLVLGAFAFRAASTPSLQPFYFDMLLGAFGAMVIVHLWGAIRRIQPLSETIEIAFWGALLVLALLFHPGG